MDFLLLLSDRQRVVIEVDGKQHYAQGDQASPALYSEMVAEDRLLTVSFIGSPISTGARGQ
jgi:very-short-patch-repair endonuclease